MKNINKPKNYYLPIEKTIYDKIEKYKNNIYLMYRVDPSYRKDSFNALKSFAIASKNEILTLISDNKLSLVSNKIDFIVKIRNTLIQVDFKNQDQKYVKEYFDEMNEFLKSIFIILTETEAFTENSLWWKEAQTKLIVKEILENKNLWLKI